MWYKTKMENLKPVDKKRNISFVNSKNIHSFAKHLLTINKTPVKQTKYYTKLNIILLWKRKLIRTTRPLKHHCNTSKVTNWQPECG